MPLARVLREILPIPCGSLGDKLPFAPFVVTVSSQSASGMAYAVDASMGRELLSRE
jgi:hypothetical protein